jgi:hypothetical protein
MAWPEKTGLTNIIALARRRKISICRWDKHFLLFQQMETKANAEVSAMTGKN